MNISVTPHQLSHVISSSVDSAELVVAEQPQLAVPSLDELQYAEPPKFPQRVHSPMESLPPETLTRIFELCMPDCRDALVPVTVSPQGPFSFAQVCKLWRAITESYPCLWTSISFYFPDTHEMRMDDVQRVQPVFDLYLQRSGTLPLSFTFIDHRDYDALTKQLVSLLVDRLRMHSHRWKRILLHLSPGYFPLLFTFTPCDLSCLEHLEITSDVREEFVAPCLDLKSAANLKSFSYAGSSRSVVGMIDAHWEQLADVSFDFTGCVGVSFSSSQRFIYLDRCRNITTCSLGIERHSALGALQTFTLPYLRTLRVRRLAVRSDAGLLDALVVPQLQALEIDAAFLIDWYGTNPSWHDRNFSNLLARSGCALLHLSIKDVYFPSDELVRCLALCHTLTSLRFIPLPRSQDIGGVIQALDVSRRLSVVGGPSQIQGLGQALGTSGPLVPELREVTLGTSREGCLDAMMTMFRSHAGAANVVPPRRIEVVFFYMPHLPGDVLGRVARLRRDLAQWVSETEMQDEDKRNARTIGNEGRLEASVVIDSPYVVEYIHVE